MKCLLLFSANTLNFVVPRFPTTVAFCFFSLLKLVIYWLCGCCFVGGMNDQQHLSVILVCVCSSLFHLGLLSSVLYSVHVQVLCVFYCTYTYAL